MRWVVIGSSGYIGSALCRFLVLAGEQVLSISRREFGPANCEHRQVTIFDAARFADVFRSGDIIVYTAGLSSSSDCRNDPELAELLNCRLPSQLLDLADSANAEQFLYLSSIKALRPPAGELATEESGEPATDPYGGSKWRAEQTLRSRPLGIRVNVLRPAAVYGSAAVYEEGAIDSSACEATRTASPPPKRALLWKSRLRTWSRVVPFVPATGYRSFVALEDLLSAIVCVGKSDCRGEVFIVAEPDYYNLASISTAATGRSIKSSQIATRLALLPFRLLSAMGVKTGFVDVERSELYSARHLKARLNWQPRHRYSQFLGEE